MSLTDALAPLREALDAASAPVPAFIRDDDAGWDDARLFALLDGCERHGAPIDLAVIPQATGAALATSLCARKAVAPRRIGLHQHGYAHTNHQVEGRKCEFADARGVDAQLADIVRGREQLQAQLGTFLDPIFTPPWNRCGEIAPVLLAELGYAALSRSRGALPLQSHLPELPVDVDWCKHQRLAREDGSGDGLWRIARALAACVGRGAPIGLMLHHAAMDSADLQDLDRLLAFTASHPRWHWQPMRELLPGPGA